MCSTHEIVFLWSVQMLSETVGRIADSFSLMLSTLRSTGLSNTMASALMSSYLHTRFFLTFVSVGNLCMQLAATSAQCGANENTAAVVGLMAAMFLTLVLLAQATGGSQMDCEILHFPTKQLLFSHHMGRNEVPPVIKMTAMPISSAVL